MKAVEKNQHYALIILFLMGYSMLLGVQIHYMLEILR